MTYTLEKYVEIIGNYSFNVTDDNVLEFSRKQILSWDKIFEAAIFCADHNIECCKSTKFLAIKQKQSFYLLSQDYKRKKFHRMLVSSYPSKGFKFLKDAFLLDLFPELNNIVGIPQDPNYHPEGDVWNHTLLTLDAAVRISDRENLLDSTLNLLLAALCHDLGKFNTTKNINGKITSHGHDVAGIIPTRKLLHRMGFDSFPMVESICQLVKNHMIHFSLKNPTVKNMRRLNKRLSLSSIHQLFRLIEADYSGRYPLPPKLPKNVENIKRFYINEYHSIHQ